MIFEIDSMAYSGPGTAMLSEAGIMSIKFHKDFTQERKVSLPENVKKHKEYLEMYHGLLIPKAGENLK